jgi:VanZ family protein
VALLVVYVVFVAYGSFFPFNFAYDPHAMDRLLDSPLPRLHDAGGRRLVSLPDLVSNVLLGAPVGILMISSGLAGRGLLTRVTAVVALDATLAATVEIGQLYLPGRTASLIDVVAQVIGSIGAAVVTHALLAGAERPAGPRLVAALHRRPALAGLLVVVAVLAADALYPFAVTLDVSTVWENLKAGTWRPLGSLARAFWPDQVVEKALAYAAAAVLARAALAGVPVRAAGLLAWIGTTLLAFGLEGGKLMIVGRAPNVDNVLLATAGGLLGVTVLPALARLRIVREHGPAWLVAGAVALLVYEELTPFAVVASTPALSARIARIEWVPFTSYYGADAQSALFDLAKKVGLGALVGAAMRHAGPRPRLWLVLVLGALLEAAQVLQPVHTPAVTDALMIYVGALVGARLVARNRAVGGRSAVGRPTA